MAAGLRRVEGPECPDCGCEASTPIGTVPTLMGGSVQRLSCDHCGREFTPPPPPAAQDGNGGGGVGGGGAVIFHVMRCPECGSRELNIKSTRGTIRHHKCKACGHCFKSVER